MDNILRRSLEPALADLRATGGPLPAVEDSSWTDDPGFASAMLGSSDGSGQGVSVNVTGSEAARIAEVADQVQQWAIEDLWGHAPTNWPPCPRHPHRHPLAADIRDDVAVWACPADRTVITRIGRLRRQPDTG